MGCNPLDGLCRVPDWGRAHCLIKQRNPKQEVASQLVYQPSLLVPAGLGPDSVTPLLDSSAVRSAQLLL